MEINTSIIPFSGPPLQPLRKPSPTFNQHQNSTGYDLEERWVKLPDCISNDKRIKSLEERQFIEAIMRGLRKQKHFTRICLREYAETTGRNKTNVARMVRSLIKRGIITRYVDNHNQGRLYGITHPDPQRGILADPPKTAKRDPLKSKSVHNPTTSTHFFAPPRCDLSLPSGVIFGDHSSELLSLYPFKKKEEEVEQRQQRPIQSQAEVEVMVNPESNFRYWSFSSGTAETILNPKRVDPCETVGESNSSMAWSKPELTQPRKKFISTWNHWKKRARLEHTLSSQHAFQINNVLESNEDALELLDRFLTWCQEKSSYDSHSLGLFLKMVKEGDVPEEQDSLAVIEAPPAPPQKTQRYPGLEVHPVPFDTPPPAPTFASQPQIDAWNAAVPTRKVFGLTKALDSQIQQALTAGLGQEGAFDLLLEKISGMVAHERSAFLTLQWLLKDDPAKGANWLRVLNCEYDWMIVAPPANTQPDYGNPEAYERPVETIKFWDTMYCDDTSILTPLKRVLVANKWLTYRVFLAMKGKTKTDLKNAEKLFRDAWGGDKEAGANLQEHAGLSIADVSQIVEDMKNGIERFPERFELRKNRALSAPWEELPDN